MIDTLKTKQELRVLRCQLGEPQAFREMVELMEASLHYYIKRLLQNESDTYDVLQQVWVDVFRKIKSLRNTKAFRTWIYRIAHHKAVSLIRKEVSIASLQEASAKELSAMEQENWEPEDSEFVHKSLDKLNPLHREVLTLHFLEEMKYEDIADVTGCSIGTVKSRLHYAKQALRRLMESQQ